LPAKPSSEPPVAPPAFEDGLIATIERIELEISALDKQREALKIAVEIFSIPSQNLVSHPYWR
jgi:hypothetical protein